MLPPRNEILAKQRSPLFISAKMVRSSMCSARENTGAFVGGREAKGSTTRLADLGGDALPRRDATQLFRFAHLPCAQIRLTQAIFVIPSAKLAIFDQRGLARLRINSSEPLQIGYLRLGLRVAYGLLFLASLRSK